VGVPERANHWTSWLRVPGMGMVTFGCPAASRGTPGRKRLSGGDLHHQRFVRVAIIERDVLGGDRRVFSSRGNGKQEISRILSGILHNPCNVSPHSRAALPRTVLGIHNFARDGTSWMAATGCGRRRHDSSFGSRRSGREEDDVTEIRTMVCRGGGARAELHVRAATDVR
jgi:hypothetical protein